MRAAYEDFFSKAFKDRRNPYPYQINLAIDHWPDTMSIPTGLGKTAAIVLAWMFKRLQNDPLSPRRLAYCLPTRGLVEQTTDNIKEWKSNLVEAGFYGVNPTPEAFSMLGGHIDREWDSYPERESIIVGTQDQLLSRALNRGYSMSRFRWPIDFGLLHNDCFWVMDEVQLMGVGLCTTAQLEAFRRKMGTCLPSRSLWMSATIHPKWLSTVDFKENIDQLKPADLSNDDRNDSGVQKRITASKMLYKAQCDASNSNNIADFIVAKHKPGTKTLVVVNTVKRAQDLYRKVSRLMEKKTEKPRLSLIHSRFRLPDRRAGLNALLSQADKRGTICIATQVVEAGIDVSAQTMITDLAPWASLVQRFGRVNRYGDDNDAVIYWLDVLQNKNPQISPYELADLQKGQEMLQIMEGKDACPNQLLPATDYTEPLHVLRKKDILELFDTTSDLAGHDIDVTRFIRTSEERDVQVYWRSIEKFPLRNEPEPLPEELCNIPVGDLKESKGHLWYWDHLDERWAQPHQIVPGMTLLMQQSAGGYDAEIGWTGNGGDIPSLIEGASLCAESDQNDPYTATGWQTLQDHTRQVVAAVKELADVIKLPINFANEITKAARWHDAGKAHHIAQMAILGSPPEADPKEVWAKSGRTNISYSRKGFRHELASAMAAIRSATQYILCNTGMSYRTCSLLW